MPVACDSDGNRVDGVDRELDGSTVLPPLPSHLAQSAFVVHLVA